MILADAGGSNSCRSRVWKTQLQEQLADAYNLEVTVCHHPTGCSKWNPIEHRLFSHISLHISLNWAGVPLHTFATICRYIAGTVTATGLRVTAALKRGGNETGERVTNAAMAGLRLICPTWNYTLAPRSA